MIHQVAFFSFKPRRCFLRNRLKIIKTTPVRRKTPTPIAIAIPIMISRSLLDLGIGAGTATTVGVKVTPLDGGGIVEVIDDIKTDDITTKVSDDITGVVKTDVNVIAVVITVVDCSRIIKVRERSSGSKAITPTYMLKAGINGDICHGIIEGVILLKVLYDYERESSNGFFSVTPFLRL